MREIKGSKERKMKKGKEILMMRYSVVVMGTRNLISLTSLKTRTIRTTQTKLHLNLLVTIVMKLDIK